MGHTKTADDDDYRCGVAAVAYWFELHVAVISVVVTSSHVAVTFSSGNEDDEEDNVELEDEHRDAYNNDKQQRLQIDTSVSTKAGKCTLVGPWTTFKLPGIYNCCVGYSHWLCRTFMLQQLAPLAA